MIKGKTIIELTDVNTQEKEVHEDCNMMTNGLAHALTPKILGVYNMLTTLGGFSWKMDSNRYDMLSKFIGGIFLFDSIQNENADNYIIDETHDIIGKGTNSAYSGGDIYCGSYNVAESGRQSDGTIKFVWDFATNQGNGTINSLSLTTYKAGYIGYGSKENCALAYTGGVDYYFTPSNIQSPAKITTTDIIQEPYNFSTMSFREENIAFADEAKNILGVFEGDNVVYSSLKADKHFVNSRCLKLATIKMPFSSIGIFNDPNYLYASPDGVVEISIPESFLEGFPTTGGVNCSWYYHNGIIYFIANMQASRYWKNGEILKVLKIKALQGYGTEVLSVTNNTGEDIHLNYLNTSNSDRNTMNKKRGLNGGGINICDKYIIATGYSGKYYRIMLNDSTDVIEIKHDGESCIPVYKGRIARMGKLFFVIGHETYYSEGPYDYYIINGEQGTINPFGLNNNSYCPFKDNIDYLDIGNGLMIRISSNTSLTSDGKTEYNFSLNFFYNPYILFTINNLSEPVVKTADKTMKVIYTLSEDME